MWNHRGRVGRYTKHMNKRIRFWIFGNINNNFKSEWDVSSHNTYREADCWGREGPRRLRGLKRELWPPVWISCVAFICESQ